VKILLANKYFYRKGGSDTSFYETGRLLEKRGHKVIYFSMKHPRNLASPYERYFVSNVDYEKDGIRNGVNASLKLLYSVEAKRKLEALIRDERPDVAHLHSVYHQISPSIIHSLKKNNVPVIMTLHDYKMVCASYSMLNNETACEACKNGRYYHCFLKGCVKASRAKSVLNTIEMYLHHKFLHIYDLVNLYISPSKFLKNKIIEMGFKREVTLLPYFMVLNEHIPQYSCKRKNIIYFGRLSREKGIITLIDAVKGLNTTLEIIGEGPIKERLEAKVKSQGLSNVKILGYKLGNDLKNAIRDSMFVVVPSEWYENYPFSVIESFSLGKTVIGSKIGGIPELVKDNDTGLTYEPGNVQDLKTKIQQLLSDPSTTLRMGKNGRDFVEQELNEQKHYQRLVEIYHRAIEE